MKKIYISPNIITVTLSARRQFMLQGSLTTDGATFYDEDATGEAMTKGYISNKNIWEEEW